METKKKYYLLGRRACEIYDYSLEYFINRLKTHNLDWDIYEQNNNTNELLSVISEWGDYTEINKKEYLILKNEN